MADYDSLQASIASWLNRDDLSAQIPDFIRMAEEGFERQLRIREMITVDSAVIDEDYEALPDDFLELKSLRFKDNPTFKPQYVTPDMIEFYRTQNHGAGGTPRFYTIIGNNLLFDRTPTGDPVLEITSYVRFKHLSDDDPENTLLDKAFDLYLYGSLIHAEPFLKNDERVQTWAALYSQAKSDIIAADRQAEMSPSPMVMRPKRSIL
jgi:hypothetical protein